MTSYSISALSGTRADIDAGADPCLLLPRTPVGVFATTPGPVQLRPAQSAPTGIRTPNPRLKRTLLCQLSYKGEET